MASGLLYGRLCIIIAVTILLFLPLTFSANNNNDALATSIEEDYWYDLDRRNYELFLDAYQKCLKSTQEWNEAMAVIISISSGSNVRLILENLTK